MSTVDSTINNFIEAAERFVGVKEGTTQHAIILALYNSNKPKGEYEMTTSDPWCAAFVGAIAGACGLGGIIPISAACDRMINRFREMGATMVTEVQRGDIAFCDWTGDGDYADHVGIVTVAEPGHIRTIEGNKNDAVGYRDFTNGPVIFFRPNWGGEIVKPISNSKIPKQYYNYLTWDEKCEIKTFPTLKVGSKGVYVKILQDFLGVETDGCFGPVTNNALLAYQCENELEADGICGRQTWSSFFV